MNRGTAKNALAHEQLVKFLTDRWNETKTKEADLEDMKSFLHNFVATVKAHFDKNISIHKIQDLFMVSDCQACLQGDVINNEVEFKTREGRTFSLPGDSNFNKICCKFFEFISKEKLWRGYSALQDMFDQTKKNNPSIDCLGIALKDVLRRLMKSNVVEAKYFKASSKKTLTREQLVQFLTAQWNETKTQEAGLDDMKKFLQNFETTVKEQFDTDAPIEITQKLFMASDSQACLEADVENNEVEFKTKNGRTFDPQGNSNFDKICYQFFKLISAKQHRRNYSVLKDMFYKTQRNNPNIDCKGIALKDVLRRLMKSNVIEARYFKAKSKKTVTREKLKQTLTSQWNETKTREADLDDMKNFLQNFEAKLKEQFDTDAPIQTMQDFFMVSDTQACLECDLKNNEVEFKTKNGRTFDPQGNSNFDKICYQFFKLISAKQHWRGYAVLKDMFDKTQRNNPNIDCKGIALNDVLRRLMKSNVIEARYFRANSKPSVSAHETVSTLAIQLIAHIGILAAGLPENREALKAVYWKFVENIQNKPPGMESVTFDLIVQHLKSIEILKVLPGAADIVYLKETSVVIYEYFGRQENCSSEDTDGQASNDTNVNNGMTGSRIDLNTGSRNDFRNGSRNDLRIGKRKELRTWSRTDLRTGSRIDLRGGSRNDLRTGSRTNVSNHGSSQKQGHTINKEKMKKLAKDAHGISITSDLDNEESREFGIIDIGSHMQDERAKAQLTIFYTACDGGEKSITLAGCKLLDNSNEVFTIGDRYNIQQGKEVLPISAGSSYQIAVYYKSKHIGKHKCPLELQFNPRNGKQPFSIFRFIEAETKDSEIDELQSNEPYQPKKKRQVAEEEGMHIVGGEPPEGISSVPMEVYLGDYSIPSDIRCRVKKGGSKVSGAVKEVIKSTSLEPDAYLEKFHALLYLEELQMETNIRDFDMERAELVKAGKLLALEVPGLAEGKPSLLVGDQAYVRVESVGGQQQIKYDRKEYQGYIHVVERDRILLKFSPSFHDKFTKGQRHRVRFSFNRGTIRLQHRAIDMACELIYKKKFPSVLDPQESKVTPLLTEREVNRISCYNPKIEGNAEQLTAVKNIVAGSSGSCPYIIFGPPGTGKTVTCVEAMKQVLKLSKKSRILACTPSNSAADLILQRLIKPCPIPSRSIFRFNAFSRSLNTLPDDFNIKDFCKIEDDAFEMPTEEEIENYRVVICTMATAGKLVSMGVPIDHFTHIFLDECGQAVEPEALIPLAGLIDPENEYGGQVVLAGDPKQLGPVLQSPIAIRHGLEVSLLERIMETGDVYQRKKDDLEGESISRGPSTCQLQSKDNDSTDIGRFDNRYITKLVMNYRTHPDILRQPNSLFYSNELIPSADNFKVTSLCQWSELPTKDFPIIFHGVEGEDAREGSSPSFFNRHEAVEVVKYVRALLDHKSLGVTPDEIGIISPYKKQVSKIRQLLMKERNRKRIEELKIGSVEEFQGQERRIIVISTVRSNREYLKMDSKFCLGFLKNPKRFNVAITRAQALLIVVGNPFVLAEDHYWKVLLDYCIEHGGYKGCKYNDDVVSDLSTKFSDMMKAL